MASRDFRSRERPVEAPDRDALRWPPLRSDLLALACFAVVVYCLLERTWPVLAFAAFCGAMLAGLAPRMRGEWWLRMLGGGAGGSFRDEE